MRRRKRDKLPVQPAGIKAQIAKTIKKALIQEREAGNLPSNCRIKIGWVDRIHGRDLHITISGLSLQEHLPKVGKDGKVMFTSACQKMHEALRKVLKNNNIEHFYIESRYGDADNTQEEEE